MNKITILTRSKEPFIREVPVGMSYLNYVSTFTTASEANTIIREALDLVETPYMAVVDSDDEIPAFFPEPQKGIIYGDNRVRQNGIIEIRKNPEFTTDEFYKNPFMFHKAIVNVAELKVVMDAIGPQMPHNFYSFHYYFVAITMGAVYDPLFQPVWNKNPGSLWSKLGSGIMPGVKVIKTFQGEYLKKIARYKKEIGYVNET